MKIAALFVLLFCLFTGRPPSAPEVRESDRIRIAEAFRISEVLGDTLWPQWNKSPFALLLVTPEHEFLFRHPRPTTDFISIGYDSLLKCDVFYRPRIFETSLLATFPAVNGISTIVIGQPENTDAKRSTRWVLTMLHEHFHQYQSSSPDYFLGVQALGLSGGDESGMWMINYAFPYDSTSVDRQFMFMARKLYEAVLSRGQPEFVVRFKHYQDLRKEFRAMLSENDYRYFLFQLWQEGVARYTELRMAELIAREYSPTDAFRSLIDYQSFRREFMQLRANTVLNLRSLSLKGNRRTAFYPFGAGEALLLDQVRPRWREEYLTNKFSLDRLFDQ